MTHDLLATSWELLRAVLPGEQKDIADFARAIRGLTAALWRGTIDEFEFVQGLDASIRRRYREAWLLGAKRCGVTVDEMSTLEAVALEDMINRAVTFAPGFARSIVAATREEGALLRTHAPRADMWVNGYNQARNTGQQMACRDQKLRWVWDPQKEHCVDCANLNGQVRRATFWQEVGIAPQSQALACHGFRCGCRFVVSKLPISRGRLPGFSRAFA